SAFTVRTRSKISAKFGMFLRDASVRIPDLRPATTASSAEKNTSAGGLARCARSLLYRAPCPPMSNASVAPVSRSNSGCACFWMPSSVMPPQVETVSPVPLLTAGAANAQETDRSLPTRLLAARAPTLLRTPRLFRLFIVNPSLSTLHSPQNQSHYRQAIQVPK